MAWELPRSGQLLTRVQFLGVYTRGPRFLDCSLVLMRGLHAYLHLGEHGQARGVETGHKNQKN
jgi:hypothetical protein